MSTLNVWITQSGAVCAEVCSLDVWSLVEHFGLCSCEVVQLCSCAVVKLWSCAITQLHSCAVVGRSSRLARHLGTTKLLLPVSFAIIFLIVIIIAVIKLNLSIHRPNGRCVSSVRDKKELLPQPDQDLWSLPNQSFLLTWTWKVSDKSTTLKYHQRAKHKCPTYIFGGV